MGKKGRRSSMGLNSDAASAAATEQKTLAEMTDDEKIDFVAARILREHRAAFEMLAKA